MAVSTIQGLPAAVGVEPIVVNRASDPEEWNDFLRPWGYAGFHLEPAVCRAIADGLKHRMYYLEARQSGRLVGVLPVAFVRSTIFGRFLVSLPYLNTGGLLALSRSASSALLDAVVELADELNVKHAELRLESALEHPRFRRGCVEKVHMRLTLPMTEEELWDGLKSKVRNQVRKGLNYDGLEVFWGREELLDEFYAVFCRNMRDLGTPPFSSQLFRALLEQLPDESEICAVRLDQRCVAAALLLHGPEATQVPSASSLREFNSTNANMLMYWELLKRAVERGQTTFDFGRSSEDGSTYRFKKQWGASPHPTNWMFYQRHGEVNQLRPENASLQRLIQAWKQLPVWVTRIIGPSIVRGIP